MSVHFRYSTILDADSIMTAMQAFADVVTTESVAVTWDTEANKYFYAGHYRDYTDVFVNIECDEAISDNIIGSDIAVALANFQSYFIYSFDKAQEQAVLDDYLRSELVDVTFAALKDTLKEVFKFSDKEKEVFKSGHANKDAGNAVMISAIRAMKFGSSSDLAAIFSLFNSPSYKDYEQLTMIEFKYLCNCIKTNSLLAEPIIEYLVDLYDNDNA